jgi:hypothetical protein
MVLNDIINEKTPPQAVRVMMMRNIQQQHPDVEIPRAIDMPGSFMIAMRDPYIVRVTSLKGAIMGTGHEYAILLIGIIESPSYRTQYRKILEKTAGDVFGDNYVTKYKKQNTTGNIRDRYYTFKLYTTLDMYPRIPEFFEKLNTKIDKLLELIGGEEESARLYEPPPCDAFSTPINEEMLK